HACTTPLLDALPISGCQVADFTVVRSLHGGPGGGRDLPEGQHGTCGRACPKRFAWATRAHRGAYAAGAASRGVGDSARWLRAPCSVGDRLNPRSTVPAERGFNGSLVARATHSLRDRVHDAG